jgi:hypothetical protein
LPFSACRALSAALFAAAFPLPALRTDFDDFSVFETADVRRFAGVLALADFFELIL